MEKWRVVKDSKMDVKKILPQKIWCDPEQNFPLETKHQFDATKVYLLTDGEGHEACWAICPKHNLPICVEPVRRRLQTGDGKPSQT